MFNPGQFFGSPNAPAAAAESKRAMDAHDASSGPRLCACAVLVRMKDNGFCLLRDITRSAYMLKEGRC